MPETTIKILFVEDTPLDQQAFHRLVDGQGQPYQYNIAGSVAEARQIIARQPLDVIVLDYALPDGTAFDLLDAVNGTPCIVTADAGQEDVAVQAMARGATDYLIKDPNRNYLKILPLTIERARRHKHAEKALQTSEQRYRTLLGHLPVGVYRTTPDGRLLEANLAAARLFGFDTVDAFKTHNVKTLYLDDADRTRHLAHLTDDLIASATFPMRRRDGAVTWVRDYPRAIHDDTGTVVYYDGILVDVTDRKRAEEEIHQIDLALEHAMRGISRLDREGCFVMVKDKYAEMLGYRPDELLGLSWQATVPEEDHSLATNACQVMLETGQAEVECRALRKDGSIFYKHLLLVKTFDERGDHDGHYCFMRDVTEQKKTREQEAQLGRILDESLNEIYIFDADTLRFLQVNRSARKNLGYSLDELRTLTPFDLKPALTPEAFAKLVDPLHTGALQQVDFTAVHRRKDGSSYPVEVHLQLSKWEQTTVFVAIILDITNRKQIEEALHESEEKYRRLVELAQEGIWVIDADANTTFVNASMARMLGYTPDEMHKKSLFSFMDEQGVALAQYNLARRKQGINEQHDFEFVHKEGRRIYTLIETASLTDEAGTYLGAIAGVVDITERKQAEETLRKSQNLLSLALKTANAGAWEWNVKTNQTSWSDEIYALLGLPVESCEASYETWLNCVHPDDREALERHVRDALEHKTNVDFDYRIIWPDGTIRWTNDKGTLLLDDDGEPAHMYGFQIDITERKQAEEILRESEERFQSLLHTVEDVVWAATGDGLSLLYANTALEHVYGRPIEAFLEDPATWLKVIHSDDRERVEKESGILFEKGRLEQEYRIVRPDGGVRWIYDRKHVVFDEAGNPARMGGLATDITDRKRAEEALRQSEEFNRRIVEAIPSGIVRVSAQGAILYANDEAQRILGLSYNALTESYVADFEPRTIWEDGSPCPAEDYPVSKCLQTGVSQPPVTIGVHRPDGTITWAVYTAVPLLHPETDQVDGAVVTFLDITQRKQAAEALKASEQRNRALLDGIPDMIFRIRNDGTFLDYKAEAREELAIPPEAIIGNTLTELPMPAEFVQNLLRCIEQAMTTSKVQTYEYALPVPIGLQTYEARIVRSGADEVVCIVRNVTEHKRAEAEQERLIDELEARNAELERFTYTVSHDLKTPLVTIKGFLGLLQVDVTAGNEEAFQRDLAQISNAADQMGRLLNELLDLSRIGRVVNPSEEVSLTDLACEAADLVADQITKRGVSVAIAPDLPVVFGDRIRLLEVLQNLIDNAVKFMGPQPEPRIEIGVRNNDGGGVCYVRDNGMGIARPYQERVFGLFNRLDTTVEGTGIGLALVKRIIEMHGGRIWVESEGEGHGSTFCFTLLA